MNDGILAMVKCVRKREVDCIEETVRVFWCGVFDREAAETHTRGFVTSANKPLTD